MNTPSPLIPQGVTPAKGKSSFFIKVLMILTLHVVVIGGMLLQGCKDTKNDNSTTSSQDNTTAANTGDTLPPATSSNAISNAGAPVTPSPIAGTTPAPMPAPTTAPGGAPVVGGPPMTAPVNPLPPPVVSTVPPAAAPDMGTGATKEYVIVSGDTLGAIAHRNGVSLKALKEANPGVNPKKLQVGQKIAIPAGGAIASTSAGGAAPEVASGDESVYTVKSGDTLGRIAKANHTSYKKIMAMNDLKTTSIRIGQKLKIPAKPAETPAPAPVVPAPTPPSGGPTTASNQ